VGTGQALVRQFAEIVIDAGIAAHGQASVRQAAALASSPMRAR
jgi:hypothetical protein